MTVAKKVNIIISHQEIQSKSYSNCDQFCVPNCAVVLSVHAY